MRPWITATILAIAATIAGAGDGLRIAAWNITYYNGFNAADIQNTAYGQFNGASLDPDVILLQEITTLNALNLLVGHLNTAAGSPGDWTAGQFYTAPTSGGINTALIYRSDKLDLLGSTLVKPGTSGQNPRNVVRYDLRLKGYATESATISMYPSHMKAGSGSSDQNRRRIEAEAITADIATLPAGRHFVFGGDTNTQSSSQAAFVELVGAPYNTGPFIDPIRTPGNWNNNSFFRYIHTQDPATQVDDRHDMLLVSPGFGDGVGLEYLGDFDTPFATTTWDDPDHSYRCWGNDGSTYNAPLNTTTNAMVGPSIAQSIKNLAGGNGHCPVYLVASVPAVITTDAALIDFGDVELGATASVDIGAGSGADAALWGLLIEGTAYSFVDHPSLDEPIGGFADAAGGGLNTHTIVLTDTATPGVATGILQIISNDGQTPVLDIPYTATIVAATCTADINGDGLVNLDDVTTFITAFQTSDPAADFNNDGLINFTDVTAFIDAFVAGC